MNYQPPPNFRRVTLEQLAEMEVLKLSDFETERAAARAVAAMERMENRLKSPLTTAFINRRN